jgi:hypothetical protein
MGFGVAHRQRHSSRAPLGQVVFRGQEVVVPTQAPQDGSCKAMRPRNVEVQRTPHIAVFKAC